MLLLLLYCCKWDQEPEYCSLDLPAVRNPFISLLLPVIDALCCLPRMVRAASVLMVAALIALCLSGPALAGASEDVQSSQALAVARAESTVLVLAQTPELDAALAPVWGRKLKKSTPLFW